MNTEQELIQKIQTLKQIKPREDWVVFTKNQILKDEPKEGAVSIFEVFPRLFFRWQPALATLVILGAIIGAFGFSFDTVPGDTLYPLKKLTEGAKMMAVNKEKKPELYLKFANKRLEELTMIAQANLGQKLSSAINEFQEAVLKVDGSDLKIVSNPKDIKGVAKEIQELKENINKIASLGVVVEVNGVVEEVEGVLVGKNIEMQIKNWEAEQLSEDGQKLLEEAKEYYAAENYDRASQALYEIWFLNQQSYK